ncbi:hypothetical protein [Magnetofaba australis]|nr:hypothetical protein [Magnetofaba australis]
MHDEKRDPSAEEDEGQEEELEVKLPLEEIAEALEVSEFELENAIDMGLATIEQEMSQILVNGRMRDRMRLLISYRGNTVAVGVRQEVDEDD